MAVDEEYLKKVLDEIRPNLQADGGDLEYVGVDEDGVVSLELQGACAGVRAVLRRRRFDSICAHSRKGLRAHVSRGRSH